MAGTKIMVTRNDITNNKIQSKVTSKNYLDNYDKIFGKKVPIDVGGPCGKQNRCKGCGKCQASE